MKSVDDIKKYFRKSTLSTNPDRHEEIFKKVICAHEQSVNTEPVSYRLYIGKIIMKNPIAKIAAAAVISLAALIGINQLGGSGSSVVWGEVAEKIQDSRGLIYRESHPDKPDEAVQIMFYDSATRGRTDLYKQGQIVRSIYSDYSARDFFVIHYKDRCYFHHPMDDRDIQDHLRQMHLKDWVEAILSRQHTNLGRRTIEGVLCEGIETKSPIFGDVDSPVEDSVRRVWVNVETGYPLLCEGGTIGDDGKLQVETVLDQFQWDVELDDGEFEPSIPPDYEQM